MIHAGLIPWLDPHTIISAAGPWALLVVCGIVFAETGRVFGAIRPAATMVVAGLIRPEMKVEIEVTALKP